MYDISQGAIRKRLIMIGIEQVKLRKPNLLHYVNNYIMVTIMVARKVEEVLTSQLIQSIVISVFLYSFFFFSFFLTYNTWKPYHSQPIQFLILK